MVQYLSTFYPFSITASSDKTILNYQDTITFQIDIVWPYETTPVTYFGQDEIYSYNNTFSYYTKSGNTYSLANIATESAYNTQKSSLYLEKDDADSFFGMMCSEYEDATNEPCLVLNMRLLVEQVHS